MYEYEIILRSVTVTGSEWTTSIKNQSVLVLPSGKIEANLSAINLANIIHWIAPKEYLGNHVKFFYINKNNCLFFYLYSYVINICRYIVFFQINMCSIVLKKIFALKILG